MLEIQCGMQEKIFLDIQFIYDFPFGFNLNIPQSVLNICIYQSGDFFIETLICIEFYKKQVSCCLRCHKLRNTIFL